MLRLLPKTSSLLISTLPVHSPAFFPNLSQFFLSWLWLTPVPVQARKIEKVTLPNAGSRVGSQRNINRLKKTTTWLVV